jgi:hypothetical protein
MNLNFSFENTNENSEEILRNTENIPTQNMETEFIFPQSSFGLNREFWSYPQRKHALAPLTIKDFFEIKPSTTSLTNVISFRSTILSLNQYYSGFAV